MIAAALLLATATLQCPMQRQDICSAAGCRIGRASVMVKLDRDGGRYERCNLDGTKCDTYPADFVASGVFTSAIPRGRATFSRYTSDGEITEVVTLGHDVMVNRGRCVAR